MFLNSSLHFLWMRDLGSRGSWWLQGGSLWKRLLLKSEDDHYPSSSFSSHHLMSDLEESWENGGWYTELFHHLCLWKMEMRRLRDWEESDPIHWFCLHIEEVRRKFSEWWSGLWIILPDMPDGPNSSSLSIPLFLFLTTRHLLSSWPFIKGSPLHPSF